MSVNHTLYFYMTGEGIVTSSLYSDADMTKLGWTAEANVPDALKLAYIQSTRPSELEASCQTSILQGFSSSALGTPFTYPADEVSQRNLISAATASLSGAVSWSRPFWCADSSSAWAMRPHTAAQMQQVNADFDAFVAAAQAKLVTLKTSLAAATNSETAAAIIWSS